MSKLAGWSYATSGRSEEDPRSASDSSHACLPTDRLFTGQIRDTLDPCYLPDPLNDRLYFFRARYYDATIGKFGAIMTGDHLSEMSESATYRYPLAPWAVLLYGVSGMLAVAFGVGFVVFLGWLLGQIGPLGWLVVAVVAVWATYSVVGYLAIFTPVVVGSRGFSVRVLFWWSEVPWQDVVGLKYAGFPYHLVYVRRHRPLRRMLLAPFAGSEPIALVLGLRRRRELFWEIWRRASQAQGRDVPVSGIFGRIPGRD